MQQNKDIYMEEEIGLSAKGTSVPAGDKIKFAS
jgi:hypothetical protein